MPRRSRANEAPDPSPLLPTTRECTHSEGGIVRLFNGVPVVVRTEASPRLRLDHNTPNKVDAIKTYLEREIILADKAGDAKRAREARKMLEDILNSCWSWYTQSESWGKESFQIARTDVMRSEEQGSLERDFWADIQEGRKAMEKICGFSSC
jgi:hypothetical protein